MAHKWSLVVALVFSSAFAVSAGCAPRLGDKCKSSTDCSVNGDRACDIAQPGGYCTIVDCSPGGCGDEGYCVRFRPDEPRLSRNYCMARCSGNRDCNRKRDHKDYACRTAFQINDLNGNGRVGMEGMVAAEDDTDLMRLADDREGLDRIAEVIDDKTSARFCVVKEDREGLDELEELQDAGVDAGPGGE